MLPTHQPYTTAAYPSNVSQLIPLPATGKRSRRSKSDSDSDSDSSQERLKKLKQQEQREQKRKNYILLATMLEVGIDQKARIDED
ncbi:MAG: hypothetical protein AAHH96_00295 [Candidatus Symbiodolus clandestinus]